MYHEVTSWLCEERKGEKKMNSVHEMSARLSERASVDGDFRSKLLSDPKAAVYEELGIEVPNDLSIKVHENDMQTIHLALPATELAEEQLEAISAGRCCCCV